MKKQDEREQSKHGDDGGKDPMPRNLKFLGVSVMTIFIIVKIIFRFIESSQ